MRASAIISPPTRKLLSRTRAVACGIAAVMLAAVLATSPAARAETDTTSVERDALARIASDALSQGATGPGPWKQRALLVGLGVAGLHLGASAGPIAREQPASVMVSAAYRLLLPVTGAALGSLVACHGACRDQDAASAPLLGAMAGALVADVLAPGSSPGRRNRPSDDTASRVAWTPVVSIAPGSYSVGFLGRF